MTQRETDASSGNGGRHASRTGKQTIDANPITFCDDKGRRRISARRRLVKGVLALLAIAPLLGGCGSSGRSYYSAAADARAELRHEQDCANPKWKAANPGLYDNLCPSGPYR